MGNNLNPNGFPPPGGKKGGDKKKEPYKKREAPPQRVGRKKKKKGVDTASKLPTVTPNTKCRLRLLKLERIKDYLLMEQEFIENHERMKPSSERQDVREYYLTFLNFF